jgi:hypothetical protein
MNSERDNSQLQGYLTGLDQDQLDEVLKEVLIELRKRESEQVKRDVLTHSQKLHFHRNKT